MPVVLESDCAQVVQALNARSRDRSEVQQLYVDGAAAGSQDYSRYNQSGTRLHMN
jgi:hypothetical protein